MAPDRDARIRERAYEIWENEGRPAGRSEDHWRQALAEFEEARGEQAVSPAAAARRSKPAARRAGQKTTAPRLRKPKAS